MKMKIHFPIIALKIINCQLLLLDLIKSIKLKQKMFFIFFFLV